MLKFLKALSILLGTVVGAGIFGLPYVVEKSGLTAGFFYLLILGGAVLLIHLFFGEVIFRTKDDMRLPGLAHKYLGRRGKIFVMISVVIGITGALLAYLILAGKFFDILLPFSGLSQAQLTLIFGLFLSYFIFRGIKIIASVELLTNLIFFSAIAVILIFCLPKFNFDNIHTLDVPNIFLPFGVILFSLIGWSAIPEIVDFLKPLQKTKDLRKVIISAAIIVILFYLIFTVAVIGVAGHDINPDVLSSLAPFLGTKIVILGVLAALITLADSYLVLGLYLKNTFVYDLKLPKNLAALATCALPLLLFAMGLRSFITTLGFVGTVVGVIEGAVIILIFKKAKRMGDRQPEYSLKIPSILLYFLIAILVLGALSQLLI